MTDAKTTQVDLVSVVMPAWNVASYITLAINSVRAQTWPRIELIAVDDGSTDGTGETLERLADEWTGPERSLRLIRQANAGAAAARNAGLAGASGEYVALFDADDICHPELVARQVRALQDAPELDLVYALYRYVDADGAVLSVQGPPSRARPTPADLLCDNLVHAPLFRANVAANIGGLDTSLRAHIDLDFFLRVLARREGSIGVILDVLSDYRRHGAQITGDWRRMRGNWNRVKAKAARAGLRFTRAEERGMRARTALYWATLAYQAGDYGAARALALRAVAAQPRAVLSDPMGRVRLAACGASLLPARLHERLRGWFNARQAA